MAIAQQPCKRCNVNITGATAVQFLQEHGGLCSGCRGEPVGLDGEARKHEICEYCHKEFWQH